jgi:hypothetical protein
MMAFLRQLAPSREAATGAAVGVAPSRFANERPLRTAPHAPKDEEGSWTSPKPSPSPLLRAAPDAPPASAPITEAVPLPSAARPVTQRPAVEERDLLEASLSIMRDRPTETAWRLETRQLAGSPRDNSPAAAHAPDPSVEPVQHGDSSAGGESPARSTHRYTAEAFGVASPTGVSSTRAPISHAALATHMSPLAGPRPVIHVTIDRIDVRAPAVPREPAAPRKSRAAAPSVSLSAYLRAGRPDRTGGVS